MMVNHIEVAFNIAFDKPFDTCKINFDLAKSGNTALAGAETVDVSQKVSS